MMKKRWNAWWLVFAGAMVLQSALMAAPQYVDDRVLRQKLEKELGELMDRKEMVSCEELSRQLDRKSVKLTLPKKRTEKLDNVYETTIPSVAIISGIYDCGKCDKWHASTGATAWALTEDGIMVTNHHVFEKMSYAGMGIITLDGKVAPVVEILASDEVADVAIFRVGGSGFTPLPLGDDAKVGSDVHIISNPSGRYFSYTSGKVSRYFIGHGKDYTSSWMAVTAEYAKGSSGAPVMDNAGNAVGVVSNTQSIYYKQDRKKKRQENFQMVIRSCVPVEAIRKLIEKP